MNCVLCVQTCTYTVWMLTQNRINWFKLTKINVQISNWNIDTRSNVRNRTLRSPKYRLLLFVYVNLVWTFESFGKSAAFIVLMFRQPEQDLWTLINWFTFVVSNISNMEIAHFAYGTWSDCCSWPNGGQITLQRLGRSLPAFWKITDIIQPSVIRCDSLCPVMH